MNGEKTGNTLADFRDGCMVHGKVAVKLSQWNRPSAETILHRDDGS
jgi:hypothetical protein